MPKLIIGIVGENAAGKTTATEYLKKKFNAVTFRFSDMLYDIAKRIYLEPNRANLQTLSTILRQNFGDDIMSKVIAADAKNATSDIIITEGVRRPSDVPYLKELSNFALIYIQADERVRFSRLANRGEKPDDATKTWEEFQKEGLQESEQQILAIAKTANYTVDNNNSLENTYRQLDEIVAKHL
jgi:dephospho-CoA kinase